MSQIALTKFDTSHSAIIFGPPGAVANLRDFLLHDMEELIAHLYSQINGPWIATLVSVVIMIAGAVAAVISCWKHEAKEKEEEEPAAEDRPPVPASVNYHFTRQCNYQCGFCFHTAKTSFVLPIEEAKRGLRMLAEKGKQASRQACLNGFL